MEKTRVAQQKNIKTWARQDSNLRPTGYASHYGFRRPFRVCGLDCPFTQAFARGCLPSSLYTFPQLADLARDYHATTVVQASPSLTGITYRFPDKQPLDKETYLGNMRL